jgi:ATP-dependent DNA helicase RecG
MRPEILYPLFVPVTSLSGVGPRLGGLIAKAAGENVVNLLWHLPSGLIDRRYAPRINEAEPGRIATITLLIDQHLPPDNPRRPYRVRCSDGTGFIDLVFFHVHGDYLEKSLPVGQMRVASGMVEEFNDFKQMPHPDHIGTLEELEKLKSIEPIYPLTGGLSGKILRKAIKAALGKTVELPEWQDEAYRQRRGWLSWHECLLKIHAPESEAELSPLSPARQRLAFDELLANQLALALVRQSMRRLAGRPMQGNGGLRAKVKAALSFTLTGAQERSLSEIFADMAEPARMLRLLQGDVGSGKTVVALMAMLNAVECGAQAALMAPTEILARQHFASLSPLAEAAGVGIVILTGRDKGKTRKEALEKLASGEAKLAVGTHALLQEGVEFKDLALAVIDEQHRFGVHQRLELAAKGRAPDVLVMTATPIPRTLTMTAYGDMDVSRLDEKPPGRKKIVTRIMPLTRLEEVVAGVGRAIAEGARVYWVCPLVEESEVLDLAAANARHDYLGELFHGQVGLIHGRMKGSEKDAVMSAFSEGRLSILVATTVIEVGVDVPEASIIVVEHAERFGLAQLHQLRGRVGRGERSSSCLLLYGHPLGEVAKSRLSIMRESDDGFVIAEEDLRLRGAGEILGSKQSGLPEFRLADLSVHGELLAAARDDAKLILDRDAELASPRGQALRTLLYLFERDAVVKTLRSG